MQHNRDTEFVMKVLFLSEAEFRCFPLERPCQLISTPITVIRRLFLFYIIMLSHYSTHLPSMS